MKNKPGPTGRLIGAFFLLALLLQPLGGHGLKPDLAEEGRMELLEPETWRRLPTPALPGTMREMMEAPQRMVAALLDTEAGKFGARKAVQLGKAFPILGFGMRQLGEVGASVAQIEAWSRRVFRAGGMSATGAENTVGILGLGAIAGTLKSIGALGQLSATASSRTLSALDLAVPKVQSLGKGAEKARVRVTSAKKAPPPVAPKPVLEKGKAAKDAAHSGGKKVPPPTLPKPKGTGGPTSVKDRVAALEGSGHKVASKEMRPLLPGEGKVGTYGELFKQRVVGDNLTPNHVPQSAYMQSHGVKHADGISMWMEQPHPGMGGPSSDDKVLRTGARDRCSAPHRIGQRRGGPTINL